MSSELKLSELLGFDSSKNQAVTSSIFSDALKEINDERIAKAKEVAKEKIKEAIDLQKKMKDLKSQFEKEYARFEKELGKIMASLSSMNSGAVQAEPVECVEPATPAE